MSELVDRLIDAQVDWCVERLSGEAYRHSVEKEWAAWSSWAQQRPVADYLPEQTVNAFVSKVLRDWPASPAMLESVQGIAQAIVNELKRSGLKTSDLMEEDAFVDVVHQLAQQKAWRARIMAAIRESDFYREFIADLLYQGIRAYLLEENALAKKLPGMASLMKMGRWGLNKMPQFEQYAEATIRAFLDANLTQTLNVSEQIINQMLEGGKLEAMARDVWRMLSNVELADLANEIDDQLVSDSVAFVWRQWSDLRGKDWVDELVKVAIGAWYAQHAQTDLKAYLEGLQVTDELVTNAYISLSEPLIQEILKTGFLQNRLRENMKACYASEAVMEVLQTAGVNE